MAVKFAAPQMGFTAAAQMAAALSPKDSDPYAVNYYGPTQQRHHFFDNAAYRDSEEMKRIQKLTNAKNNERAKRPHR